MKWKEVEFKDIVVFPPKVPLEHGETYDFIPMDIVDGGIKYVRNIQQKQFTGGGAKFANGDTIFARITPCLENGKIAKVKSLEKGVGFGSTEYFVFRAKEEISDADYVYYLAKSDTVIQPAIKSMVGASGRQRADKGVVEEVKINLPPLSTQRRIASILSAYDDLIENNLNRIKLLEEAAQNIYKEWFVHFRFPNHENTEFGKDGLPKGWEKKFLGDVGEVTSSKRIFLSDYVEDGVPFYRGKEISQKAKYESINEPYFITKEKFEEIKAKFGVPIAGDFLITAVGTLGNPYLVNESDGDFYFKDGNLIWIRNIESPSIPPYLFSLFKSPEFQLHLHSIAIGSSQKALTIIAVKKIELIIPSNEVLKKYEAITQPMLSQMDKLFMLNQKFKEARDILLPRLMNQTIEV